MTQPQSQGFPDYQRKTPATNVLYDVQNTTYNAITQSPKFFCGYEPATRFRITSVNQNLSIVINWFDTQAGTHIAASESFVTQANDPVDISFPNKGPWFSYSVIANVFPITVSMTVWTAPHAGHSMGSSPSNILIGQENAVIGAGLTLSIFSTEVWPGPAMLHIRANGGPYTVSLAAIDIAGARVPFYQHVGAAAESYTDQLFLPASIIRIIVTNSTAGNITVSPYVVANPIPSVAR